MMGEAVLVFWKDQQAVRIAVLNAFIADGSQYWALAGASYRLSECPRWMPLPELPEIPNKKDEALRAARDYILSVDTIVIDGKTGVTLAEQIDAALE